MREPFHTDILRWIMTSLCTFVIINDVRLLKRTTTTTTNSQNEITFALVLETGRPTTTTTVTTAKEINV